MFDKTEHKFLVLEPGWPKSPSDCTSQDIPFQKISPKLMNQTNQT